ncbi:conjugal transfer protein TrbL family protein [Desulfitobacterium chlororespirans]|uniref:TrbL/VirB6 plasmid conjugal transfer protein n=1 Tax=Desulfitobacterium chlororespirans DSM 11544 TaxID=1121395 RepID=A0A1M7UY95_9FIRM|nr:conjugal transfer protein TrbL family protein [Desulfitobacterium chlororespirans]SHN87934.1 hypothetical protein SAMN02745215_05037 [Desulfitobacterium chlororespirans DSM 11544]
MEALLMVLIEALLSGFLEYMDLLLINLIPTAFYAENVLDSMLGFNVLSELYEILFMFGISLIILKFVQKGFNTYVLWIDGDADTDPIVILTYFIKALVVAISFPTLYGWLATIMQSLTDNLLDAFNQGLLVDFKLIVESIMAAGLLTAIMGLIYFGSLLYFYIKFLKTSLEILILKLGVPIACVGLIDSDQGVFKTYIQKFFQAIITVMLQIVLLKLSFILIVTGHLIWAIVAMMMAHSTPRFLQEFVIPSGPGGNVMGKAYYATQMIRIFKR